MIQAYAVQKAKGRLKRIEYDPGVLGPDQVEINVIACGLCHCAHRSDRGCADRWSAQPFRFAGRP